MIYILYYLLERCSFLMTEVDLNGSEEKLGKGEGGEIFIRLYHGRKTLFSIKLKNNTN